VGIIFDIKRFAVHDGPGIRTTVFFKGCPLSCPWCHNPESKPAGISKIDVCYKIGEKEKIVSEDVGKNVNVNDLTDELMKDLHVMEESGGGVTISGGEPMFQFDFLKELLISLKENGIHTCVDTTGYANGKRFEELISLIDLFLYDMKHYDEKKHLDYTGVSLNPILRNLNIALKSKSKLWLRIPIIPDVNDSQEDAIGFLNLISEFAEKPDQIHLLPFHNIADDKYFRLHEKNTFKDVPSMDTNRLSPLKELLEQNGYTVKTGA